MEFRFLKEKLLLANGSSESDYSLSFIILSFSNVSNQSFS